MLYNQLKYKLVIPFFLLLLSNSYSQEAYKQAMYDANINFYEVCTMAEQYFSTIDRFKKGSGWNEFMRWKSENEGKYYPDGNRQHIDHLLASKAFLSLNKNSTFRSVNPSWKDLGPYSADRITQGYNPGIGRIECFEVNRSNTDEIYLGSRSGGFWKTTDGGKQWINTTDFLTATGVNTMAAVPDRFNEILINVRNAANGYSHGIYRSIDSGQKWEATILNPLNGFGGLGTNVAVNVIRYHPLIKDLVFIGTNKGLYRSSDNLKTQTLLLSGANITEIAFHPTDSNAMYLMNTTPSVKGTITLSINAGKTFFQSAPMPGFDLTKNIAGYIDVTPAQPNNLYFASTNDKFIYKSVNKGLVFEKMGAMSNNSIGNFAISDQDTLHMVSGYLNLEGSSNGGLNFVEINRWNTVEPDDTYTHADLRAAKCIDGVFYIGTDGYLSRSYDNGATWERLNNGTGVREFYRIGISQSDRNIHIGGSQDNGTSILDEQGWLEWNGGDGMEAVVHPLEKSIMMGSWQYGSRQLTLDGGKSRLGTSNPQSGSTQADWIAPLVMDPSEHMNVYHFSDSVFISNRFGEEGSWNYLSNPNIGVIRHAAIAENNSDIMVVAQNSRLNLSVDKGLTWKSIFNGLPSFAIADVVFDPNVDSTIVVCFERYEADNKKIYISHNLGRTWTNITYNLGKMPLRTIAIDHSRSRNIYVGAEIGLYVKSMSDTMWRLYNEQLPNTTVRDLEIHNGSNTLKAATWGRGLWEVDLIDRASYPKINKIIPSVNLTTSGLVPRNVPMNITADIDYSKKLSQVYLLWSHDTKSLDQKIDLISSNNKWNNVLAIPPNALNQAVYFKVYAIGEENDTTETYTYMYRQGDCKSYTVNVNVRGCGEYILQNDTIKTSGNYKRTYKDNFGCDSIITYRVTIDQDPIKTVITENNTLKADEANATSYQWLDCNNQLAIIPGQNKRVLTINQTGNYAVEIKKNSCTSISDCYQLVIVSNHDEREHNTISIWPNPNTGIFELESALSLNNAYVQIHSIEGKRIFETQLDQHSNTFNLNLKTGIYFMTINQNGYQYRTKLMIQQ
ncbi:MAG: T9SS type A sorting domain-containing protein [Saprospiraceae bacterium]|jgi:photosystem II stability/assembly factor-like uncharacterized protein|nr:T9SS type A sorting domain-containing protein [Saprospiraceae bacterium]